MHIYIYITRTAGAQGGRDPAAIAAVAAFGAVGQEPREAWEAEQIIIINNNV